MDELAQDADVWLPWNGHLASGGGIAEWSVGPQGLRNEPLGLPELLPAHRMAPLQH